MAFQKLYYSRAKDDFKIMSSEVSSSFLTLEAVILVPLVKYFSLERAGLLSYCPLTLVIIEMYYILANVGL